MVAATFTQQPAHLPPTVPTDPSISGVLSTYLQQLSLWCKNGFADKIKNNVAQNGLLLQAFDAPHGTTPPVFLLQVKTDGTLVATRVAVGTGL